MHLLCGGKKESRKVLLNYNGHTLFLTELSSVSLSGPLILTCIRSSRVLVGRGGGGVSVDLLLVSVCQYGG